MELVPETVPASIPTIFDVFINHRGPDVKKTIASLIYHRLKNFGYNVFLDKNEINPGDIISPKIRDAIESASVHVAIFSEHYAESTWCLEELHLMLKSFNEKRSRIITVFSDVQPHDLRYIDSGCYAKIFKEHELKGIISQEKLKKWKAALNEASHISGLLFKTKDKTKDKTKESDYGDFLEDVAKAVLNLEASKSEPLEVAKYPVGLDQAAEDFRSKILEPNHSKAKVIVVIAGMLGVGKSTLAKYLFNQERSKFSSSCFLNDVRTQDLPSLQQNLFHDLFGNNYLQRVPDIKKAMSILGTCLVVLDDVDGVEEMAKIESLLDMVAMASGSLIMITSRNKGLFTSRNKGLLKQTSAKLDNVTTLVYDVKPLKEKHARDLFCKHSFALSTPPEEFKDLVALSLQICGGFPLFLEILGGIFVDRPHIKYWKKKLKKFSITPPKDIMDQLKGIYNSLDTEEKNLFLDIGCFLVGEEKELATRVLEGLYENADIDSEEYFESLLRKCLVDYKIECRKREDPMIALSDSCRNLEMIAMPDPLRKLARYFARQDFGRTQALRLSSEKDIEAVPTTTSKHQIRGIRFSEQPTFGEGIRVNSNGVRLFVAEGRVDLSSFFDSWKISGELVWLRLGNLSYFHFPPSISLQTLRVLELVGSEDSVEHFFKNFNHDTGRRELNTVDAGASTSMGRPAHSSSIFRYWQNGISIFSNWKQQTLFQYLKSRVTGMETLTNLELKNITSLRSLPIDFSRLQNLTQLDLSGCVNLTALPSLSNLVNLEFLNINGCSNLEILNVEGLTSLKEIKTEACWNLKRIDGFESAGMVELSRHFNRR